MKYKNTLQKGSARFIVFREGDTWYCVCLEFNIVESGSTPSGGAASFGRSGGRVFRIGSEDKSQTRYFEPEIRPRVRRIMGCRRRT